MLIHLFFATGRAGGADCVAETNGLHDKGDEVLFVRSVGKFLEHQALSGRYTGKINEPRFPEDTSDREDPVHHDANFYLEIERRVTFTLLDLPRYSS